MLSNIVFQYPVPYINNIYVYDGSSHNQRSLCHVDLVILCVYGWCIMLVTCKAQLIFQLLLVNLTTACINYYMLSAGYLSIQIKKHLLVFSLERGDCTVVKSKFLPHFNSILVAKLIWSIFLLYLIWYKQITIWIDMLWSKSPTMVKTPTKMQHTVHWMNDQLNKNLNDILLI